MSTAESGRYSYSWPDVPVGEPDNIASSGQTVQLPDAPKDATAIGLLGSATNGKASGTLRITYADGSTQSADVGFSDWTLGAGADRPSFGNVTAADTPYRNSSSSSQRIDTYLFGTAPITLQSGKTVRSVTLPGDVNGGGLHVFSIGFGTAAG